MAKSFRRFREEQYDDWDNGDDEFRSKQDRLKERRLMQREKNHQKMTSYDAKDDE